METGLFCCFGELATPNLSFDDASRRENSEKDEDEAITSEKKKKMVATNKLVLALILAAAVVAAAAAAGSHRRRRRTMQLQRRRWRRQPPPPPTSSGAVEKATSVAAGELRVDRPVGGTEGGRGKLGLAAPFVILRFVVSVFPPLGTRSNRAMLHPPPRVVGG